MITVKDLKDMVAYCDDNMEVKIYVKNLGWKICYWYFAIADAEVKDDGLYIELE
jgi:hypothetical protein